MSTKSLVLSEEEIARLKEMTANYKRVTPPQYANYNVTAKELEIIIYNSKSVVFIGKNAMKYYEEFLEYRKGKSYDEIGADETGKEFYGPMVTCAVYYDDQFNQDLLNDPEIEIKDSKGFSKNKEKLKEIAEKLMDPKNKLKFTIVEAIGDYPSPERNYAVHRLDYDEINEHTKNANGVQAVLLNEVMRLSIKKHGKPATINYDRFTDYNTTKKDFDPDKAYYELLEEAESAMAGLIPEFKIVEGTESLAQADAIVNSPSAAASIIAKHVRNEFFEFVNEEYQVIDEKTGKPIPMPDNDREQDEIKKYGVLFIEKYGKEKFDKFAKKTKNPYNEIIDLAKKKGYL